VSGLPTTAPAQPVAIKRAQFRGDIQGLRAIAVLLVVAFHASLPLPGGYIGVDVFFVISGFLITNHLLAEVYTDGRLQFGRFYARRVRRILPASFVVLVGTIVAAVIFVPPALLTAVMREAMATALYVPNLLFAWQGTDYLAETAPSPFQHYWSLGVEEQFYLLWPLALVLLWMLVRHSRRALTIAVAVLVLLSFTFGLVLTYRSQPWAFFSLPARAWELGVGALVAIGGPQLARLVSPLVAAIGGWLGVAALAIGALLFNETTAFPGTAALVPVLGAAAIIFFGQVASRFGPTAALSVRPMQFIGAISYSLYLVHWPLLIIPTFIGGKAIDLPLWATVLLALVGVPLAWLLYRFVENPVRTSRALSSRRPRFSILLALVASVLTVALAGAVTFGVASRPTSSSRDAAVVTELTGVPTFTDFVPANLSPSIAEASSDNPSIYASGCHLDQVTETVQDCVYGDAASETDAVLFGDSHAAQWFPGLERVAEEQGLRLHVFTKSSCPSATVTILEKGVPYAGCDRWRAAVIDRIAELEPQLVVLSNFAVYPDQGADGIADDVWSAGLEATINAMPDATRTVVFADTPSFTETPAICLSANIDSADRCSAPRSQAAHEARAAIERDAAADSGAAFADFTDLICDADTCGTIIGSTLVYRDAHHISATFSTLLAPNIWRGIRELLQP